MKRVENINIMSYFKLIHNLNIEEKMKIILFLSKSVIQNSENQLKLNDSYGKLVSDKDADTIIEEIHEARRFKNRDINI